jgi:hypothetical protein
LESRLLSKFLSEVVITEEPIAGYIGTSTGCADEDEQVPTSWLDFVPPRELIHQADPP